MAHVSTRARRSAVAGLMGLTMLCAAPPAHADTPVWVAVKNGGTDNVLVQVTGRIFFSVTSGCSMPSPGTIFAVCLPGGATMAFTASLPSSV